MNAYDAAVIRVHSEWNGWLNAEVRVSDLEDVRWFQPNRAPHPIMHAHVSCSNIVTGTFPHACERTSAPHRLLVCILKKHVIPTVYAELARRADEPGTPPACVPAGSKLLALSHTIGHRTGP
jgi:hypothetical protein